jgi:hypothetical protein
VRVSWLEKSATAKWLGALPRPSHSSCGAQHLHAESSEVAMWCVVDEFGWNPGLHFKLYSWHELECKFYSNLSVVKLLPLDLFPCRQHPQSIFGLIKIGPEGVRYICSQLIWHLWRREFSSHIDRACLVGAWCPTPDSGSSASPQVSEMVRTVPASCAIFR